MSPASATLKYGDHGIELPVKDGTLGPSVIDISKLYAQTGLFTFDPGFTSTASTEFDDHLHRRRRRRAALSRLPDRPARRARRLSRDLLSPALRRTADHRPKGRFRLPRDAPHDGARADGAVLPGVPTGRAPDVGHGRLRRRDGGVLSRLHRHQRPVAARDRIDPDDRQAAHSGRDGLQVFDRPAVHLPQERCRLRRQFPADVLRGAVRGIQGQSGSGARARSNFHPARRPRAERIDVHRPPRRIVGRQSLRLHRRRHRVPLGSRARRRQRGGVEDAGRDRLGRQHSQVHRQGQGQERSVPTDGLRPSRLQELRSARQNHAAHGA